MRKFLTYLLVCFSSVLSYSQNSEKIIDELTNQILTNPENPLRIDQKYLLELAQQVKNPQLSNTLFGYGTNLNLDKDTSYRQMYYDIATAFESNPELLSNTNYSQTANKLNILFNNYDILSNKMKEVGVDKYEFGMFVNDPNLIDQLSGVTGSYESALSLGLGVEFILSVANIISENKKFKEDYKKLAAISKESMYAESDTNLTNALIDACLLISNTDAPFSGNRITPLFRFDFKNGASLRVENGALKYFNSNGTTKTLLKVQKKHDGDFYSETSFISMPIILISDD